MILSLIGLVVFEGLVVQIVDFGMDTYTDMDMDMGTDKLVVDMDTLADLDRVADLDKVVCCIYIVVVVVLLFSRGSISGFMAYLTVWTRVSFLLLLFPACMASSSTPWPEKK